MVKTGKRFVFASTDRKGSLKRIAVHIAERMDAETERLRKQGIDVVGWGVFNGDSEFYVVVKNAQDPMATILGKGDSACLWEDENAAATVAAEQGGEVASVPGWAIVESIELGNTFYFFASDGTEGEMAVPLELLDKFPRDDRNGGERNA